MARRLVGSAPRVVAAVAGVLLVLAACGGSDDDTTASGDGSGDAAGGGTDGCLLTSEAVGEAVGAEAEFGGPTAGGTGGGSSDGTGDYSVSWEGCTYTTTGGEEITVAVLVDGDEPAITGFEQLVAAAEQSGTGSGPTPAPGLGDAAVRDDDRVFVRVGDRVGVAEVELPTGEPAPVETVDGLGSAVAAALA